MVGAGHEIVRWRDKYCGYQKRYLEIEHEQKEGYHNRGHRHGRWMCASNLPRKPGCFPGDLFRQITVDYTLAFARSLHKASLQQAAFCFLSGQGADQTERSRVAFARYKGAAEKRLLDIGLPRVHLFRPGYIYPVTPRREPNLVYTITRFLYPMLRMLYPNIGISSEDLAAAMVHAGLYGTGDNKNPIWENKDIRSMVGK